MPKLKTLLVITIFTLLLASNLAQAEKCNKKQAELKRTAMGSILSKMFEGEMAEIGEMYVLEAVKFRQELAAFDVDFTSGKYAKFCEEYDELAKKYNVDLAEETQRVSHYIDIENDRTKANGKCTSIEANKKMMDLLHIMEDKRALGEDIRILEKMYHQIIESKSNMINLNPSAFCDELDSFKKDFDLK